MCGHCYVAAAAAAAAGNPFDVVVVDDNDAAAAAAAGSPFVVVVDDDDAGKPRGRSSRDRSREANAAADSSYCLSPRHRFVRHCGDQ